MLFSLQFPLPPIITSLYPLSNSKHFSHVPHHQRLNMLPSLHVPKSPFCSTTEQALIHQGKEAAFDGTVEDRTFPFGLRREEMPTHLAVIMDGNRRWARLRDLPVRSGYEAGVRSLRKTVELCCKWGIKVFSVFAFSTENWFRPKGRRISD